MLAIKSDYVQKIIEGECPEQNCCFYHLRDEAINKADELLRLENAGITDSWREYEDE